MCVCGTRRNLSCLADEAARGRRHKRRRSNVCSLCVDYAIAEFAGWRSSRLAPGEASEMTYTIDILR